MKFPYLRGRAWDCSRLVRINTGLPLESSVKTSCVETVDYSGYEHSQNYGLIATTLQLLSSSIECVVR